MTTQASASPRNRTETGSRPVKTASVQTGVPLASEKISTRASAVFVTSSVSPSGLSAIGETGGVSKLTKGGGVTDGARSAAAPAAARGLEQAEARREEERRAPAARPSRTLASQDAAEHRPSPAGTRAGV